MNMRLMQKETVRKGNYNHLRGNLRNSNLLCKTWMSHISSLRMLGVSNESRKQAPAVLKLHNEMHKVLNESEIKTS